MEISNKQVLIKLLKSIGFDVIDDKAVWKNKGVHSLKKMIIWDKNGYINIPNDLILWLRNSDLNIQVDLKAWLINNGIDVINDRDNYKKTDDYAKIKDFLVFYYFNNETYDLMNMEQCIERYILEKEDVLYTYESPYEMGNTEDLNIKQTSEEDKYKGLVEEFMYHINYKEESRNTKRKKDKTTDENFIPEPDDDDIIKRNLGVIENLIKRFKDNFNFDLDAFDANNAEYQKEKSKILYLFYMMEKRYLPTKNIFILLSQPTMENRDESAMGWHTTNGKYIKEIKDSLEKELSSVDIKNKISGELNSLGMVWDKFVTYIELTAKYYEKNEKIFPFKDISNSLQQIYSDLCVKRNFEYKHSPIETLYIKILQHEQLGHINDILMVYKKDMTGNNYEVPPEFVDEMNKIPKKDIDVNNIDNYIEKKVLEIADSDEMAKYIYLKEKINKNKRERIRECKEKVIRLIDFYLRAKIKPFSNVNIDIFIISCLKAILSDKKNETFEYKFYGSQKHQQVDGALKVKKNDKPTYEALKYYWVRKVDEHYRANIGELSMRRNVIEIQIIFWKILRKTLKCPNLDEMAEINNSIIKTLEELKISVK